MQDSAVKMSRSVLRLALCLVAALSISSSAWADAVSIVSVTGQVWRVSGNMVYAPTGAAPPAAPLNIIDDLGTFTANKIDFWTPGPQAGSATLRTFLTNGGANVGGVDAYALDDVMSNCFTGSNPCPLSPAAYTTIIRIDGVATFVGGTTYSLAHDDGAVMWVNGTRVINSGAPTESIDSLYTPGATVSAPFTIYYSGTNGNPEELRLEGQVPDGGVTLMLLGGALVGLETLRRKFRA